MSKCQACNQEMKGCVSCIEDTLIIKDKEYKTLPYENDYNKQGFCHDCLTPVGGYHHPGCDMERCPACGGQLISCGCFGHDCYAEEE